MIFLKKELFYAFYVILITITTFPLSHSLNIDCVYVNRSPGRAIWLNYEVMEFQSSVGDDLILRLFRLSIILLIYPFSLTISSTVFWIVHSVSPSPRTYPLFPPIFHPFTPLLYIFAPASSLPSLVGSRSECPPGRRSFPPAATTCLHLPPMLGVPKEFLTRSVSAFPHLVVPPCCPLPVPRYL